MNRQLRYFFIFFAYMFKGDNWYISLFEKTHFYVGFFVVVVVDTIKARSFKLCTIITLLGVYIVLVGLVTLTFVSPLQVCQKYKLQIAYFRFLSFVVQMLYGLWCTVTMHIKKMKHSILRVTGVYVRDISNTSCVFLHLNVSRLSVCVFFFFF